MDWNMDEDMKLEFKKKKPPVCWKKYVDVNEKMYNKLLMCLP